MLRHLRISLKNARGRGLPRINVTPLQNLTDKIYVALCVIGIAVALYLSWEYLTANFTSCSFNNTIFSCEMVASSGHTALFGIPFWVLGLAWFPLSLIFGLAAPRYGLGVALVLFLMIGNIFTIYLWYLELAVIHFICPVCVSLYFVNYAMTGAAVFREL